MTVEVAEGTHLGLDGPKWANIMSIERQIDMEMVLMGEFCVFLWKTTNVRLNPLLGPLWLC